MSGQWLSLKTRTSSAAGSFLPLSGGTLTGQLAINRGTLTALSPAIDITSTWNNAAVTFTGLRYNVTDTVSNAASLLMDLQVGGSSRFNVLKSGVIAAEGLYRVGGNTGIQYITGGTFGGSLGVYVTGSFRGVPGNGYHCGSGGTYSWDSGSSPGTAIDLILARDAADTLAQRRTTNAQTFNIYNTYTSSTNHERLAARWASDVAWLDTQKGSGGGTARNLVLGTDSTERVRLDINGNVVVNTAAIATNATNGFLYVPSCAGTPTGVPTTFTGRVPIVVDTTNNKLYFYSSSAWRDAGP